MTNPVYKIEVYTAAVLDHTITSEAANIYSKEIITDGIGHFMFTVPTQLGSEDYKFDDIALNDIVKIYYGYNQVGATPNFIGRVGKISGPLTSDSGYIRIISGLSQGEILLRRFKKNKYYDAVGASTIVTEWANDLGIFGAGDITADATAVTLEVRTKNYFDLLQGISDYWFNAGNQIKKDFFVDVDGHLHWKTRPIRSGASVETLTVGDNIINYAVNRDIDAVKNDIYVHGFPERSLPVDKDSWTETLTNWTASAGNLTLNAASAVGAWAIRDTSPGGGNLIFKRTFDQVTIRDINQVNFWKSSNIIPTTIQFRLLAPDTTDYYEADVTNAGGVWHFSTLDLGPNQVYDVATNPNGIWTENGSPNWWDIQGIQIQLLGVGAADWYGVDGVYFYPERWSSSATDAASIVSYDQRDLEITDNNLHSDSDCQKRAETLLYQMKDAPTQITVTVPGNTNILVGDRLPMTIPAEGISAANYDVITVEHSMASNGFTTKAVMVDSANIRQPITLTPARLLSDLHRHVRELSTEIQRLG